MKPWTLISYYTRGTGYEDEARKLAASCDRFGIGHAIVPVKSLGSWQRNTQMKADIIMGAMGVEGADDNLVFVDADAVVHRYPSLFDSVDADLGLSYRDYARFPCGSRKSGKELLSGTIYLARRDRVREFVHEWAEENRVNPRVWEQRNLQTVVGRWAGRLNVVELPAVYCKIFDLMRSAGPAVIEHYQKSRVYRRQVECRAPVALQRLRHGGMLQSRDIH